MFTIITENDTSNWDDQTGIIYHFPIRYKKILLPGTRIIYYKGWQKDSKYKKQRLSSLPHYFGMGKIGRVYQDSKSLKRDLFASIVDFEMFSTPVLAKKNSQYLEPIPKNQKNNYFRSGVRKISESTYFKIVNIASKNLIQDPESYYEVGAFSLESVPTEYTATDGKAVKRFVTTYERNPKLRKLVIAIHGTDCFACGFNFGEVYGEHGEGFIHIHHVDPVSKFTQPQEVDPLNDLVPLCANCHSMVHRNTSKTLTISELKSIMNTSKLDEG